MRGAERIVVTQRAGRADWPNDPFGYECAAVRISPAMVGTTRADFGTAPDIAPHLLWRRGNLLYTVSGPLPKDALVRIAESLTPIRTPATG